MFSFRPVVSALRLGEEVLFLEREETNAWYTVIIETWAATAKHFT